MRAWAGARACRGGLGALVLAAALALGMPLLVPPLGAAAEDGRGQGIRFDVHEGTSMAASVSPDGRSLALDLQGSLWLLPASGGRARRVSGVFDDIRQPVWSPDGRRIAFFAYRDGGYDLWSVAADGSDLRQLTSGIHDDREPAWSPDGRRIAFASDRPARGGRPGYNIWVLELDSGALHQLTDNGHENRAPTWSPDGRRIAYVSRRGQDSGLWQVDAGGGAEQLLRAAAPGASLEAPSYGPGGELAYVVQERQSSRLEVDGVVVSADENVFPFKASWHGKGFYYVADGRIRHRPAPRAAAREVAFSAQLEVTRPHYPRRLRDFDSTAPRPALGIVRPVLSPDGRQLAYAALGDLYLQPLGGQPRNLTRDRYLDTDPAWSPDGRQLAWSSDRGGDLPQLWIHDLASGRSRQLTRLPTQALGAAWSPDGRRIAFLEVDGRWGVAAVSVLEVASGKVTRVQPSLAQPGNPTWSADGRWIALALVAPFSKSFREGSNQVYVFPADPDAGLGGPRWFAPKGGQSIDTRGGAGPVWSPDGRRMAAVYGGLLHVWPVDAEGRPQEEPRALTRAIAHAPSWSGDSRTLLYQSDDCLETVDVSSGRITRVEVPLRYSPAIPQGRLLLRVGQLVDGVSAQARGAADILVERNRIAAITAPGGLQPRPGDVVVEARGLTAMPGLVEYHAHVQKDFGEAQHRAWLAYGVTTVRDPGNLPYHGVEDREAVEAGVRIGPRIYTTGHLFEWQRVYYKMGVALAGPDHLELELQRAAALRHDLLKSYVRLPDRQQRRLVEFAHAHGIPVSTHEVYPAALVGVDATEHLGATSRRGYSPKHGPQGRSYEDVVQIFGRSGRALSPTHFGSLPALLARDPALREDPRLALYPGWAQASVRQAGSDGRLPVVTPDGGSSRAIRDIHAAGGRLLAGTDTPIALHLHAEIASYVDAGLSPYQALRSATLEPARELGLDAGSLEAGKLADIVLVQGNPLEDITATTRVRKVVANGRLYGVEALLDPGPAH